MNEDRKPPIPDPRTGMDTPDDVLDMIARAEGVVSDLCAGRIRWSMSIPARPDSDPDLVISRALSESAAEVRRLRAENATADTEANGYPLTEARLEIDRLRAELDVCGYIAKTDALRAQVRDLEAALASERAKAVEGIVVVQGGTCGCTSCPMYPSPAPDATALREAARPVAEAWERGEFFITELGARKAVALLGVTIGQLGDLSRALLATPPQDAPGEGDGSEGNPFRRQFIGKVFERADNDGREFSFGVCERDDGYEITVTPARSGPVRHYRLASDGTISDLAHGTPGEPEVGR